MHAIFIPYGIKNLVDLFIENLNQRILPLRLYKEGEKDTYYNIQCQIRYLPFGIVEFVFPKEYKDQVLTSLGFHKPAPYNLNKSVLGIKPFELLKKFLNIQDIPKFKETLGFPVLKLPMSIIPIGIREDGEITEKSGDYKGWTHEGI